MGEEATLSPSTIASRSQGNPEDLEPHWDRAKLAPIAATNEPLYRAYLLDEQLRAVSRRSTPASAEQPAPLPG